MRVRDLVSVVLGARLTSLAYKLGVEVSRCPPQP